MIIHFSVLAVIIVAACIWGRNIRVRKLTCLVQGYDYALARGPLLPWLLVFGYLAFLAGMRSGMNDTSAYIGGFNAVSGDWGEIGQILFADGRDKAFNIVANLFKMYVSSDYHAWFSLFSIVESVVLIYVLRRECVDFTSACFFFFASTLYYNYFSMMRQWLAVVILFAGGLLIKKNKTIWYILLCIVMAQFHTSALLFIPVYFMVRGEAWSRKQNIIIGLFAVAIVLLNPLLAGIESALQGTTYDYVIDTMQTSSGSSGVRVLIAAVPVVLAWMFRDKIKGEMLNICVNMSLLNFLLTILATFTSGLYVIRLSTYTNMYNIILFPYLLTVCFKGRDRQLVKLGFYALYFLFYVYQMSHQGAFGYSSDILGVF